MLHKNLSRNGLSGRVRVFDEAVGREVGTARLWVNGPSLASTAYAEVAPFAGCVQVEVPVVGLGECLARVTAPPVSLLKIDAEGAEADILEEAGTAALAEVQNVALEYHDD